MNIILVSLLLFTTCVNTTIHSMMLAYKQESYRCNNKTYMKRKDIVEKPLSINLAEFNCNAIQHDLVKARDLAQNLGELPLKLAHQQAHALTPEFLTYCSDYLSEDQREMVTILSLPVEVVYPIFFSLCNNNRQMFNNFGKKPLAEALEWLSLMQEKYKKDEKLASLISFPTLYCIPEKSIIALGRAIQHFSRNKTNVMGRSPEISAALANLPDALKNCVYFNNKVFIPKEDFYNRHGKNCNTIASFCISLMSWLPLDEIFLQKFLHKYDLGWSTDAIISVILFVPPMTFTFLKVEKKLSAYYSAKYKPKLIKDL